MQWENEIRNGQEYRILKRKCMTTPPPTSKSPHATPRELEYELLLRIEDGMRFMRLAKRSGGGTFHSGKFDLSKLKNHLELRFAEGAQFTATQLFKKYQGLGDNNNKGFIASVLRDLKVLDLVQSRYNYYGIVDWSNVDDFFEAAKPL